MSEDKNSALLIDLDGVIYEGGRAVDGAVEAVGWMRDQGIAHLFLTNTTSRPRSALVEKLDGFGIAVDEDDILTPPVAAAADNVVVGDDLRADVGGAQDAGIDGVLVRTGKYQGEESTGDIRPTAVLDSIAGLPDWWQQR